MKKGKRIAVMIDLKRHGAVWEDLYDGLSSEEQKMSRASHLTLTKKY
jgi:hypothetical protein